LVMARDLPPADRIAPLRAVAARFPDYTGAAISLLIALRQVGRFSRAATVSADAVWGRIPQRIAQFWDAAVVPPDVSVLMESWRTHHPDWEYERFDSRAAQRFLRDNFAPAVLAAYNRARQKAQKADLFRLAYLCARGGYYIDADDRCLAPITTIAPSDCELVVYQEDYGTIANDFIGVVPGHPVLKRALTEAVTAVNRGDADILWLATGPGLLSRAFVREILRVDNDRAPALDHAAVLDRSELYRAVAVHCSAAYKQTDRHWSNTVFGRTSIKHPAEAE
jgi:mannosyltransferase OCH1-like enzyme